MSIVSYTDHSRIPFGKYKNTRLIDVPASYLLHLLDEGITLPNSPLERYIKGNEAVLRQQVKTDKQQRR